jgi:hypothetical protein
VLEKAVFSGFAGLIKKRLERQVSFAPKKRLERQVSFAPKKRLERVKGIEPSS